MGVLCTSFTKEIRGEKMSGTLGHSEIGVLFLHCLGSENIFNK